MNLSQLVSSDYKKYKKYGGNFITILFFTQGFWASFQYRVAHAVHKMQIPILKQLLQLLCLIWQKIIEMFTGISIPASAQIGHSFYIGHFGGIILNVKTTIGNNCNISQGVTIGVSGPGPEAVLDGVTGLLADPHEPKDIAAKIKYLFEHPQKGIEMGFAARERVLKEFDINSIVLQNKLYFESF